MAYNVYRERHLTFTGTADAVLAALPAGCAIMCYGARVIDAAATGALALTDGASITIMSDTDLDPNTTGFKRNTTPGPFFLTSARSITADATTLADAVEVVFYCSVAQIVPGAGEV